MEIFRFNKEIFQNNNDILYEIIEKLESIIKIIDCNIIIRRIKDVITLAKKLIKINKNNDGLIKEDIKSVNRIINNKIIHKYERLANNIAGNTINRARRSILYRSMPHYSQSEIYGSEFRTILPEVKPQYEGTEFRSISPEVDLRSIYGNFRYRQTGESQYEGSKGYQPVYKMIYCGQGIGKKTYNRIVECCKNVYIRMRGRLQSLIERETREDIKETLGHEWLVYISNLGHKNYDLDMEKVSIRYFLSFSLDNKRYQIIRVK